MEIREHELEEEYIGRASKRYEYGVLISEKKYGEIDYVDCMLKLPYDLHDVIDERINDRHSMDELCVPVGTYFIEELEEIYIAFARSLAYQKSGYQIKEEIKKVIGVDSDERMAVKSVIFEKEFIKNVEKMAYAIDVSVNDLLWCFITLWVFHVVENQWDYL